jgi:hypothetical protein
LTSGSLKTWRLPEAALFILTKTASVIILPAVYKCIKSY